MSIISFCVISLEVDEDAKGLHSSFNYTSDRFKEMSSQGKGLPVPLSAPAPVVRGTRPSKQYEIKTVWSPAEHKETGDDGSQTPEVTEAKPFVSGNPLVEITKGLLHLYKDNDRLYMDPVKPSTVPSGLPPPPNLAPTHPPAAGRSEMLCILAVPASLSCNDLLTFVSAYKNVIEHIQIIRDNQPNQYLVLLKFKSQADADTFYTEFNGKKYNSFDDDICLLAYVSKVENLKACDGAGLPLTGHTELPTCPVCLERMDESVDGLLTILCNHSFHSACLAKWSDTSCPVCRYVQTPEMVAQNVCVECASTESLWICLICGHVGCGRYIHGHAYKHFCETQHSYAIQPDNNRVWDYIGDNFVHRLLQNKDGKLVESSRHTMLGFGTGTFPEGQQDSSFHDEEKIDSIQLEFTNMLTHQLETQRRYFEEKLDHCRTDYEKQISTLTEKVESMGIALKAAEEKTTGLEKDRSALDRKLTQLNQKVQKLTAELKDEKELCKVAYTNLKEYQSKYGEKEKEFGEYSRKKEKEVQELKDEIRDLMFYFEAQKKIEENPELQMAGGSVGVEQTAATSSNTKGGRRNKRSNK